MKLSDKIKAGIKFIEEDLKRATLKKHIKEQIRKAKEEGRELREIEKKSNKRRSKGFC